MANNDNTQGKDPLRVAMGKKAAEVKYGKDYGGPKLDEFEHNEEGQLNFSLIPKAKSGFSGKIPQLVEFGHEMGSKFGGLSHGGKGKTDSDDADYEPEAGKEPGEGGSDSSDGKDPRRVAAGKKGAAAQGKNVKE